MNRWFQKRHASRSDLLAALDIGTSKICCLIAQSEPGRGLQVIGLGHQMADGMKAGRIIDLEAAQQAIGNAIAGAEQTAGEQINAVTLSLTGGLKFSRTLGVELPLQGREVTEQDVQRLLQAAQAEASTPDAEIIQTIPVGYSIDGLNGIRDPLGMSGHQLAAHWHVLSASYGPLRTLMNAVARCHLHVSQIVAAPHASGVAVLVEDEMDLGAVVVDLGGGTTSFAIFHEGRPVYVDCLPMGGQHITSDIARGLTTPLNDAERLKILHGNVLLTSSDDREHIDVPQVGEEGPDHLQPVAKSALINMIRPRVEETLELVRDRLEASGMGHLGGRRVVLTGGGSQLGGVRELAHRILGRQVRIGRPQRIGGLAEHHCGPAFATAGGLLVLAQQAAEPGIFGAENQSLLGRSLAWIRGH